MKKFYDTNAVLNLQERILESDFVLSSKTLQELEHIKVSRNKDEDLKYKARKVIHILDDNSDKFDTVIVDDKILNIISKFKLDDDPDNRIIACAYWYNSFENIEFISDDICCKTVARNIFGLKTSGIKSDIDNTYKGFKEVVMNENEMAYFYSNLDKNVYDLLQNEYLIVKNIEGKTVAKYKWNGTECKHISYESINNSFTGKISPRNDHQDLVFDMLQDKKTTIKVVTGKFGSGKDFCMIANAISLINQGVYDKIVWVRNTIEVKDTKAIGYLPGSMEDKLKPYTMVLADHLGGEYGLGMFISQGKVEIQHLGFVRGRDYQNAIIMCSEAENTTKEQIQLLIGRVGEGSALWLNGDFKQTDGGVFANYRNNGLVQSINKLKGHERFGFVQLQKTERSETADMADLLD